MKEQSKVVRAFYNAPTQSEIIAIEISDTASQAQELFKVVRSEVVATSSYPVKSRVPIYCSFGRVNNKWSQWRDSNPRCGIQVYKTRAIGL